MKSIQGEVREKMNNLIVRVSLTVYNSWDLHWHIQKKEGLVDIVRSNAREKMITEEDEKKVINYYGVGNNGETGRHLKDKRKGFDFHVTACWQNEAIICRVS
ncbi:hypothetical protein NC652_020236 [Populus alba x Populus x berolinensis]|nr:hypothetical protein NC652_020015 [Populus alba x Populus x berolinensis]KAJ6909196.1 hypothetical protein NC652_020236 [Populus alba x Populus x berolinensis]